LKIYPKVGLTADDGHNLLYENIPAQGPDTPYDPAEPTERKKVHRGGSFLCTDQYCSRCVVGTRGKGEVSTGTNHLGFRCVKPVTVPTHR
jgi:formylglycine-generating enzyme required for sulfatase activity